MCVDEAIRRVLRVHRFAPKLIPMITTGATVLARLQEMVREREADMARGLPIRYRIVQNQDDPSLLSYQKGSYFSCVAQGCSDDKKEDELPKYPLAVVEGNPISDFQAAIMLAHQNKARFVLYYKMTKRLQTCWLPGGLYNEGGNCDGTAMYVDPSTGLVIPSIRLMHWHQAQQSVEKQMLDTNALPA
jgi:hypothetical protein